MKDDSFIKIKQPYQLTMSGSCEIKHGKNYTGSCKFNHN